MGDHDDDHGRLRDIAPKTSEGKIVAAVVMLIGIGTAALLIGAVA